MKLGVVDIKQVISESSEDLEEKMTSRFRSFESLVQVAILLDGLPCYNNRRCRDIMSFIGK